MSSVKKGHKGGSAFPTRSDLVYPPTNDKRPQPCPGGSLRLWARTLKRGAERRGSQILPLSMGVRLRCSPVNAPIVSPALLRSSQAQPLVSHRFGNSPGGSGERLLALYQWSTSLSGLLAARTPLPGWGGHARPSHWFPEVQSHNSLLSTRESRAVPKAHSAAR
ncbi:hypothetical protein AAFF_G00019470 [Aldrovandia affinis]|uniref:Uncharacterized protein n=1 Tax=Aldrovandia affinis TaxID=143900 RepID=A0AAD7S5J2_9TELE|nr:hypothetical protein AAFF_G00019470 [Aldrovandia affinis]